MSKVGTRMRWLGPVQVAAAGAAVVALLLIWPIQIRAGDHETNSCGNALSADLSRWRNNADGPYRDQAHRACTTRRVDRVALAVGVLAVVVLGVTALQGRDVAKAKSRSVREEDALDAERSH